MSLKELLKHNIMEVVFTKTNGEQRVMLCTTDPQHITVESFSTTQGPEHLCTVWDIESDGWRSFKLDSIKSYRIA